jgi:hypothetical protein
VVKKPRFGGVFFMRVFIRVFLRGDVGAAVGANSFAKILYPEQHAPRPMVFVGAASAANLFSRILIKNNRE